jgi:hypothetical protein
MLTLATGRKYLPGFFGVALLLFCTAQLQAQSYTASHNSSTERQSATLITPKLLLIKDPSLQHDLQTKLTDPIERQKLMAQLKQFDLNPDYTNDTRRYYYNLAFVFARVKMYPLAMKCFYKSLSPSADVADAGFLNFITKDDSLLETQTRELTAKRLKSPEITYQQIIGTFNDGKQAAAYALLIHIKQPVPGKRQVHKLADSGHSFITLIKYNSDTTATTLSFGFYPKHHHPFAGTPLFPYSHSTFKNDHNYIADETTGRFISENTFNEILLMVKAHDGIRYNLNNKNCTDFVLDAALLADINITDTFGRWPLGRGNNPGITGQGILHGRIFDGCAADANNLFTDYDPKLVETE